MISFFVQGVEIEEIKDILQACELPVRSKGFARPEEVAFFYNDRRKGFSFAGHKFEDEEIPDAVYASPFLISVGPEWNLHGLAGVIRSYRDFFQRGMPVFNPEKTDEQILEICKKCIILPWGGFPQTEESQKKLAVWLRRANKALFPLNS